MATLKLTSGLYVRYMWSSLKYPYPFFFNGDESYLNCGNGISGKDDQEWRDQEDNQKKENSPDLMA